jgi:integration host factor subunit beta
MTPGRSGRASFPELHAHGSDRTGARGPRTDGIAVTTGAASVNKSQLIDKLAVLTNQTNKVAEGAVNIFFNNIKQALSAGDKVEIRGFGSFLLKSYNAYTGRNPKTGEKVFVPKKELPFFRAGKDLREKVNGYDYAGDDDFADEAEEA